LSCKTMLLFSGCLSEDLFSKGKGSNGVIVSC
jgi:hypothetical protein